MLVPVTKKNWRGKVVTRDFGVNIVILPMTSMLVLSICSVIRIMFDLQMGKAVFFGRHLEKIAC